MINLFENEAFLEHRERYPDGAPTRRIPPHVLQQYLDDLDNAIGSARTDLANLNILACLPMTVHAALWLIPNSSIVRDPAIMQGFINLASFGVEATDALPAAAPSPPSQADIAARLIVRFRELVALDIEGSPSLEGVFGAIVECIVTGRHIRQIQGEIVDLLNQITLSFIDGASDQVTTSGSEAEEGEDGDEGNGPEFPSEAATNTELFYLEAERRLTDEDQKCMWCLYDVPAGEVATFLPCSHWFHPPCIRAWLRFNGHCPWCRQTINERIYKARYARVELDGRVIEASRRAEERRDAAVAAMQEAMSSAETDEERLRIQVEYQARVRRQIEEYRDELLYEDIIIPPLAID
ncbi:hypothetical protein N7470_001222 [Penicillium chermesinum]|nr:hypothetical protein N7470_001222 [Penicillium chermesinum]